MLISNNIKYYYGNDLVKGIYLGNNIIYTGITLTNFASGGSITTFTSGETTYYVHAFLQNDTFTLFQPITADYLIVAGGGGSNFDVSGGAGAGGLLLGTAILTAVNEPYPVIVGTGGQPGYDTLPFVTFATNGNSSIFNNLTAIGGGSGSDYNGRSAQNGGSGGGGNIQFTNKGIGILGQGNDGGSGPSSFGFSSGGGGGAGEQGFNGGTTGTGSTGGIGLSSDITGIPIYYAGGGAGGRDFGSVVPTGGLGGGGSGQVRTNGSNIGVINGNNLSRIGNLLTVSMSSHPYQVNDYGYFNSTEASPQIQIFKVINRTTNQFQAITDLSGNFTGSPISSYTMYRSTAQDGINGLGGGAGGTSDREIRGRFGGSGVVIVRYKQPSIASVFPTTDLLAFYNFQGNILDSVGTISPLITGGSCSFNYTTGVNGASAIQFNNFGSCGTGAGLFCPNDVWNLFQGNTKASFAFWFKYTQSIPLLNPVNAGCGMSFFGNDFGRFGFGVAPNNGVVNNVTCYIAANASGGARYTDPSPITVGEWNHIAGTYDNTTRNFKVYRNGNLVHNYTFPSVIIPPVEDPNIYKGFGIDGSGFIGSGIFSGTGEYGIPIIIDSLGLWTRVLTDQDVSILHNNGLGREP